ncbi:uncharacterized protein F4812DRAFT_430097 [Daldinia caldariorum]|uniref:uncharacterized protein n=1 Tax=Daldinia caldariorum TaxID=326644 RepID=UPI0020081107|nr:uncharacterized protein F4812DRAFT_430097 [Daldinia caldariorum]KAI1467593.1 hypothetical protein F4812DRAFT_430097 [Daldinia caldariorum]
MVLAELASCYLLSIMFGVAEPKLRQKLPRISLVRISSELVPSLNSKYLTLGDTLCISQKLISPTQRTFKSINHQKCVMKICDIL